MLRSSFKKKLGHAEITAKLVVVSQKTQVFDDSAAFFLIFQKRI